MRYLLIVLIFFTNPVFSASNDGRNLAVSGTAKRIALVIGNDHYQHVGPLQNAVADSRSIAAALEQAGFKVTLKQDANLAAMKLAVRQFKASLSGGDEAVIFYSGHGVQLGAANYLLPVDISSDSEEQVKDDAIPLQRLLDDLQDQKVKFALAIIDACRDNPFKGNGRSIGGTRGLAPTSAANGQMVIFSAGNGQQALDKLGATDRDGNGVFTRVFLQEMQRPGVEVHQVLRNVRSRVVQMARSVNHDQMPALYDQVEGDFYFQSGTGTQVASLVPVAVPTQPVAHIKTRDEIEQDTWEGVRDSNNAGAVAEYLKQYPKGRFAAQARVLIATLKSGGARPVEPVVVNPVHSDGEGDLWGEVQKGNSREDYDAYLAQYPKGKYVTLARSRIAKLQEAAAVEANRKEQEAWELTEGSRSEEVYRNYLKGWPSGRYAGLAQVRLRKLQAEIASQREKAASSMLGEWVLEYVSRDGCRYREAVLTVNSSLSDGSYRGQLTFVLCRGVKIIQDALIGISGSNVDVTFTNPHHSDGTSSDYSPDHYVLERRSDNKLIGINKDSNGNGKNVVLSKK